MADRLNLLRVVDPVLTSLVLGYSNNEFITEKVLPVVLMDSQAGKIPLFGKEEFQIRETKRALRAASNEAIRGQLSTTGYATDEHDEKRRIDYLEDSAALEDLEQIEVMNAQNSIDLGREYAGATLLQAPANYPSANKVTLMDDFLNEAAIDPIDAVKNYINKLKNIIGKRPNTLVMGSKVWDILDGHILIRARLASTQLGITTLDILKQLLKVDNIYVGDSIYTEDNSTFINIWGNWIGVYYIMPPMGITRTPHEPCFGFTLRLKGNPWADKYEEENGKIRVVRSTDNYTHKIVGSDSGYCVTNPIDPTVYAAI